MEVVLTQWERPGVSNRDTGSPSDRERDGVAAPNRHRKTHDCGPVATTDQYLLGAHSPPPGPYLFLYDAGTPPVDRTANDPLVPWGRGEHAPGATGGRTTDPEEL